MGSVMDTALARAEDRRRKGMVNVDAEHEAIAFGDIRVFRRAGSVLLFLKGILSNRRL